MKPFNLKEAKAGKPVQTRDGNNVRIICFNRRHRDSPIVALIENDNGENLYPFNKEGEFHFNAKIPHPNDLFMKSEKRQGFINLFGSKSFVHTGITIYGTEEEAHSAADTYPMIYITIIPIEWEE